jgi:hypothetical protein
MIASTIKMRGWVFGLMALLCLSACDDTEEKKAPQLSSSFTTQFTQGCMKNAPQAACDCVLMGLEKSLSMDEVSSVNLGTFDKAKLIEKIHHASAACKK